jgi:hypothetical protein
MSPVKLKTDSIFFKNEGIVFNPVTCEQAGASELLISMGQQMEALVNDLRTRLREQYCFQCLE